MKMNGLLVLLLSILSIGFMADAQVIGQTIYRSPVYRDVSVAPANYVTPTIVSIPSSAVPSSSVPYLAVPTVQRSAPQVTTSSFTGRTQSGLAQSKAQSAARMGLRGHLGGGLGGAKYEGVGWSNQSAQSAIQRCCYWGTRPVSQIGVAKGNDGCWYACVLYN